jgi:choline dehydrogenase-like flavoprotein
LDSWKGPFGQGIYSLEFAETDQDHDFVRGTKWMTSPGQGPFAAYQEVTARVAVRDLRTHDLVRERFDHSVVLGIQCDDLPEPDNRVELDATVTDSHGLPAPRISYRLSENSRRMLLFNLARAREALTASGATAMATTELWPTGIGHVLGTARMGWEADTSVVGVDGQAHDVPNLYVVDTSVFVTGGSMNPGATTIALAHHFADQMLATRGRSLS